MVRKKKVYWIQNLKEGTYRAQLKRLGLIKGDEKIPITLSKKICGSEIGKIITWHGKKFKVTELLKRRACAHINLVKLAKKRKKRR